MLLVTTITLIFVILSLNIDKFLFHSKPEDEDEEVVRIRGSYLADLTRAPQNSDFDSDSDETDESARGWFWQQPKSPGGRREQEGDVTDDSDVMTSSSEEEEDEGAGASYGWCNIL